jgi:hypothetical protein
MPKIKSSTIKLSPKQKEVIKKMREQDDVLKWVGVPICKYKFMGKTLPFKIAIGISRELIKRKERYSSGGYYYELTEKGKTIDL